MSWGRDLDAAFWRCMYEGRCGRVAAFVLDRPWLGGAILLVLLVFPWMFVIDRFWFYATVAAFVLVTVGGVVFDIARRK